MLTSAERAASDTIVMTRPCSLEIIPGSATRVQFMTPNRLTWRYFSQSCGFVSANGLKFQPWVPALPALFTRMSTGPRPEMPSRTAPKYVTSKRTTSALPPPDRMASATLSARSPTTSLTKTCDPAVAKAQATSLPTPWPAPVTRERWPPRSIASVTASECTNGPAVRRQRERFKRAECRAQQQRPCSTDPALRRLDRSVRRGLGVCGRVDDGHLGRRRPQSALHIGESVADHGQLLTQVDVALLDLFPVGVGVLLDEHRGNGGGQHADQSDPHQHQDDGHRPPTFADREPVPVAHGGHRDNGPPQRVREVVDVAALGVLLKEQHQPGPEKERCPGGDEHPEEAVMLEDRLNPELSFMQEEADPFHAEEVPTLEGRHQHGRGLHPPPLEIAATIGRDHQA